VVAALSYASTETGSALRTGTATAPTGPSWLYDSLHLGDGLKKKEIESSLDVSCMRLREPD